MPRIAQISYHTSPLAALGGRASGGMNVYVLELSRELARMGYEVDIFTRREGAGAAVQHIAPNLRLVRIEAGPPDEAEKESLPHHLGEFIRNTREFAAAEGHGYDAVHSHYWQSARAGMQLARGWDAPHVVMFHTLGEVKNRARISEEEPRVRIHHERMAARRADAIVTASDHERELLTRYYAAEDGKLHTIPCGIDLELFHPRDRAASREALGLDAATPVLLWVGRLEKLKGVDILIQALAEADSPDAHLLVVGGDDAASSLRTELETQAREAGLAGRVHFTGPVAHDRLPVYYAAADVCVVPSYYESFGLVAIEALACGTPVIASRVGGLVSTVTDGVNGYLIPWRCPGPFAERLDVLLSNPELRANFSKSGRRSVERFRWGTVAAQVARLYERLAAEHRASHNEDAYQAFGKEAFESALLASGNG